MCRAIAGQRCQDRRARNFSLDRAAQISAFAKLNSRSAHSREIVPGFSFLHDASRTMISGGAAETDGSRPLSPRSSVSSLYFQRAARWRHAQSHMISTTVAKTPSRTSRKAFLGVTAVKMPYPESLTRSKARTERVWLERGGTTTGCIRLEDRLWCYEYIPPEGNRAEMLRIRNEPSRGVYIGAMCYYMVDFDLHGLVDVGATTRIDALDHPPRIPIANVIQFYHRSTKRNEGSQPEYQKMYDDGIQIALKYFGE
jgi:hypothetical protein